MKASFEHNPTRDDLAGPTGFLASSTSMAFWLYLLEKEGMETADRIVAELFKDFYKLAEVPQQRPPPRRSHQ